MRRTPAERSRDWYQANARHYDRLNPGLPGDRAFYASICHGARVLEIGAGTGRITEAIAGTARAVIAVDNVPSMLTIAGTRLRHIPNVALVLADAGSQPFSAEFERIILAYRTVQHLDPAIRGRLWRYIRTHLAAGGVAAFDTWHGPLSIGHKGRGVALWELPTEELRSEIVANGLHVLSTKTSFNDNEETSSLTRVWLVTPQSEVEKSGEKFHEVLDTRGRRI
jgi:SAM-dependent methyltransferase